MAKSRCAGEAAAGAAFAASAPTNVAMTEPALTLSPTLILTSPMTPAEGAGTSIAALSDSSVISVSSAAIVWPGFT